MIKFEGPFWLISATLVGALLLWCKEPPDKLRVYKISYQNSRIGYQIPLFASGCRCVFF